MKRYIVGVAVDKAGGSVQRNRVGTKTDSWGTPALIGEERK